MDLRHQALDAIIIVIFYGVCLVVAISVELIESLCKMASLPLFSSFRDDDDDDDDDIGSTTGDYQIIGAHQQHPKPSGLIHRQLEFTIFLLEMGAYYLRQASRLFHKYEDSGDED